MTLLLMLSSESLEQPGMQVQYCFVIMLFATTTEAFGSVLLQQRYKEQ